MELVFFVNQFLAVGVILGQIFIIWSVFYFLFFRNKENFIIKFVGKNGMLLAFIVALASTLASLFYSEFIGYEPCVLCWYQRIFIYPQVIILGIALFKKDSSIINYSIILSLIGMLISLYQFVLQLGVIDGLPCSAVVESTCSKLFVIQFNYITIPLMAFTAFIIMIVFLLLYKINSTKNTA